MVNIIIYGQRDYMQSINRILIVLFLKLLQYLVIRIEHFWFV